MAAARNAAHGLSSEDLTQIREQLAAGRKPKVVFTESAGQIAGQAGQVVELTDPDGNDEWVVVRFGRDVLPFSPADLTLAPRGTPGRRPGAKRPAADDADASAAAESGELAAGPSAPAGNALPGPPLLPAPAVPAPREESSAVATPPASSPAEPVSAAKPERRAAGRKAVKPKAPASLTVTLSYTDGDWMVSAQQGSKVLAKPYVIRAAEALKMVGMLDVPGVQEAVEEIVAAARSEAEVQAERLRAELAEVEERLAELRSTS